MFAQNKMVDQQNSGNLTNFVFGKSQCFPFYLLPQVLGQSDQIEG